MPDFNGENMSTNIRSFKNCIDYDQTATDEITRSNPVILPIPGLSWEAFSIVPTIHDYMLDEELCQ